MGLEDFIRSQVENAQGLRLAHLEQLAAAYLLKTRLAPDEVVLVEETKGTMIRWYFAPKEDVK